MKLNYFAFFVVVASFFFLTDAFAAGAVGGMPYDGILTKLTTSITGQVAYAISIFGIIGSVGAMLFYPGEINGFFRTILFVVLLIAIVMLANQLITAAGGVGAQV